MQTSSPILILLAAGNSSRMGFPKGLLDYHGKPWILEQISRYVTKNPEIIIVLGNDIQKYNKQISWFSEALNTVYNFKGVKIKILHNKNPKNGAFSSLQLALLQIKKEKTVLVQPIDVPLLDKINLEKLLEVNNTIVIPKCNSKNGHPVKLQSKFWNQLLELNPINTRLDYLIKSYKDFEIIYKKVNNTLIYRNMNTFIEWNSFIEMNSI